jgi:cytochrome b561
MRRLRKDLGIADRRLRQAKHALSFGPYHAALSSDSFAAEALVAESSYDRRTIWLHWTTAILMTVLWGVAQIIDLFPKGLPRISARSVHITLGVLLGVVLVMRIVWRVRSGRRLPLAHHGVLGQAARIVHIALYAGLAAVIVLGLLNTWARGDSIFNLFHIPKLFPANPQLKPTVEYLHETVANALVILAAAHAFAAICLHFIRRDGVLRRMLPQTHAKRDLT